METTDVDSITSFYKAFAISYLKQVARFQHLMDGKEFIGRFKVTFRDQTDGELRRITNSILTPTSMSAFLTNRVDTICFEFLKATEEYMNKNEKQFTYFNQYNRIKILPDNEGFFQNLATMFCVNIIIYSKAYDPYKAFIRNTKENVCILLNFDTKKHLYSPREYTKEEETDEFFSRCPPEEAQFNKSKLLHSPYFCKPEEGTVIKLEISREVEPSSEDLSLKQSLNSFSDVLITNSAYLSEEMRNKLLELIQFDSKFFLLRNKLQSIVDCNHDDYSLFECGQQHCLECLRDKLAFTNIHQLHQESCSCLIKYSSKDLMKISAAATVTNIKSK